MMTWIENISLKKYNTFGIDAIARYFAVFSTQDQLAELLESSLGRAAGSPFILGGGSNILLTKEYRRTGDPQ
jgi:UDP-N-acetylmuramate dehydrogenase